MLPHQFRRLMELLRAQFSMIAEAINKHTDTAKYEQAANREKKQSAIGALRSISDELKAGNQQADTGSKESYGQQERLIKLQRRLVFWAALAFFAAFGYGLVAAYQGYLMHKTYGEIQKQTRAALCANETAQRALKQAADQFRGDQRPYVGLSTVGFAIRSYTVNEGEHKGHFALLFSYANFGKSPAVNVRYNGFVALGKSAPRRVKWHNITESGTGIIVPPTETRASGVAFSEEVVTPEQFADINAGKIRFILFGHFEYTDTFGNPKPLYTTEYCMASSTNPVLADPYFGSVCEAHTNMK